MRNETETQSHVLTPGVEQSFGILLLPHALAEIVVNANGAQQASGSRWRLYDVAGAGAALIWEGVLTPPFAHAQRLTPSGGIAAGARVELRAELASSAIEPTSVAVSASLVGYDPFCCDDTETLPAVDCLILGLGTSGAALARFLSEDLTTSVLALEAGDNFGTDPLVLAFGGQGAEFVADPKYHWHRQVDMRSAAPAPAVPASPQLYTDGRMWGGSSGHNYGLGVRGSPDVYDAWGAVNVVWTYDNLLPVMKWMETFTTANGYTPNAAQRGDAGPLFLTQPPPAFDDAGAFLTALSSAANITTVDDYNDPTTGLCVTSPAELFADPDTFERSWSQSAFLPSSVVTTDGQGVGGRKLEILSRATVQNLLFDTSGPTPRAIGARVLVQSDPPRFVNALATKIYLCAGTIADTAILQRSGIGDAALLASLAIPVVVANTNVGKNLQAHYGPNVTIPIDTENPPPAAAVICAFSDLSGAHLGAPTGVRHLQTLALPGASSLFAYNWLLRPTTTGTIAITSTDPQDDPTVTFDFYPATGSDRANAVKALKVWANISLAYTGVLPTAPAAALYPSAQYGADGGLAADDAELLAYAEANATVTNHACGTCKMAASLGAGGVVDGNLDVLGVLGLAVASNAVLPRITTGNTSYPAYLVGLVKAQIDGATVPW